MPAPSARPYPNPSASGTSARRALTPSAVKTTTMAMPPTPPIHFAADPFRRGQLRGIGMETQEIQGEEKERAGERREEAIERAGFHGMGVLRFGKKRGWVRRQSRGPPGIRPAA